MPERDDAAPGLMYTDASGNRLPIPDPTHLTEIRVDRATEQIRRDLEQLRQIIETRLDGMDQDRNRLWERFNEIPGLHEAATNHFRDEMARRDQHVRELTEQRLADLDKAIKLAADELSKIPAAVELQRAQLEAETASRFVAEREYVVSLIGQAAAETRRVGDVAQEKFAAIDGLFASNALALTAALAAQEKAVAEQNKSNTLAITKSEISTKETITANAAQTVTSITALADTFADIKERVVRIEAWGGGAQHTTAERRLDTGQILQTLSVIAALITVLIIAFKK